MDASIERRSCQIELREEGGSPVIEGYAAVFYDGSPGTEYSIEVMGEQLSERMAVGAFDDTLREDPIHAVYSHDMAMVLGYNESGTLDLGVDERGLRFAVTPPDTQLGRDVLELVRRGDMGGASIGFQVLDQQFRKCDGKSVREIRKCKLRDVSVVAQPAYKATVVSARSLEEAYAAWLEERKVVEARRLELLRARARLAEIGFDPTLPTC